jgi:hypothetical protein
MNSSADKTVALTAKSSKFDFLQRLLPAFEPLESKIKLTIFG